jgi:diguanylate cyclase (GGDEF)-like protein
LPEEIERMKRNLSSLCLATIDVDIFKHINDTLGHATGDKELLNVTKILKQCTRSMDILTRVGGDEFVIIFPETNLYGGYAIAERIRGTVARNMRCTISVGVIAIDQESDIDIIFKKADNLLYRAKKAKNLIVVPDFSPTNN